MWPFNKKPKQKRVDFNIASVQQLNDLTRKNEALELKYAQLLLVMEELRTQNFIQHQIIESLSFKIINYMKEPTDAKAVEIINQIRSMIG